MKIIAAPDKFKGSLSAKQAAAAIRKGLKKVLPEAEIVTLGVADGGRGTVEALVSSAGGKICRKKVTGPLGHKVEAYFGLLGEALPTTDYSVRHRYAQALAGGQLPTAVVEMAAASGLHLVDEKKRNPLKTTSYGTGQLIKAALDKGCSTIIIGIGDSATVDGGIGAMQALGVKFLDEQGRELGFGGGELKKLAKIDTSSLDARIKKTQIIVASDVTNPLLGRRGAAFVFGPQKGASSKEVLELEEGLKNFARVVRRDLKKDVSKFAGAGAAGGMGAALVAFLNAKVQSGAELVLNAAGFEEELAKADLVITGEGKLDKQTIYGKTIASVAKLAKKKKIPVIALAGEVTASKKELAKLGIKEVYSLVEFASSKKEAVERAAQYLEELAEKVVEGVGDGERWAIKS